MAKGEPVADTELTDQYHSPSLTDQSHRLRYRKGRPPGGEERETSSDPEIYMVTK